MLKEKILAIENLNYLFKISMLVGIVAIAQIYFSQPITGSLVNMALFLSAWFFGIRKESSFIAFVPSLIAFLQGQLPFIMAPMIPFIILGNIILMGSFLLLIKKSGNYLTAIISAGFIKFLFLFASSQFLLHFVLKNAVAEKFAIMMNWPQFLTALLGGIMFYLIVNFYKKVS